MSRSLRTLVLTAAVTLLAAPAARAQDVSTSALAPQSAAAPATAPTMSSVVAAPVAAHRAELRATRADVAARADAAVQRAGRGDGKVYMIVGGVAFLAGAVIDGSAGDIVMISGAVVGLYGLYLYLR